MEKSWSGLNKLSRKLSIIEKHFSKFPLTAVFFFATHDWIFNWQTKGVGGAAWEAVGGTSITANSLPLQVQKLSVVPAQRRSGNPEWDERKPAMLAGGRAQETRVVKRKKGRKEGTDDQVRTIKKFTILQRQKAKKIQLDLRFAARRQHGAAWSGLCEAWGFCDNFDLWEVKQS